MKFSDVLATTFSIINNQFYYKTSDDNGGIQQYMISNDEHHEIIDYIYCGAYQNFYLAYEQGVNALPLLNLIDSEAGGKIPLITNNIYISEQSIYKDTLYYRYFFSIDGTEKNIGNICSVNLTTRKKKYYDTEKIFDHSHNLSYNFANDKLYLMVENAIAEIDLITDKILTKDIQNTEYNKSEHNHQPQNQLYSDGKTIYLVHHNI